MLDRIENLVRMMVETGNYDKLLDEEHRRALANHGLIDLNANRHVRVAKETVTQPLGMTKSFADAANTARGLRTVMFCCTTLCHVIGGGYENRSDYSSLKPDMRCSTGANVTSMVANRLHRCAFNSPGVLYFAGCSFSDCWLRNASTTATHCLFRDCFIHDDNLGGCVWTDCCFVNCTIDAHPGGALFNNCVFLSCRFLTNSLNIGSTDWLLMLCSNLVVDGMAHLCPANNVNLMIGDDGITVSTTAAHIRRSGSPLSRARLPLHGLDMNELARIAFRLEHLRRRPSR